MPDYDIDPVFEHRLAGTLRAFSEEGVVPYDAMAITTVVTIPVVREPRRGAFPEWLRPILLVGLLALMLVAVGVAGGFIRLPTNVLFPDPSFQPFSPPPLPTSPTGSLQPGASPLVTIVPGSGPPSTAVPATIVPGATPTAEPSALPSSEITPEPTLEPSLTPEPSATPEPTPEVTPSAPLTVVDADAGNQVWCAIASDRRIYCAGSNNEGELGDGTNQDRFVANVPVLGIDDAIDVAAGIRFVCAARSDRSVWCWGEDPGSDENLNTPRQVPLIDDAVAVTAGGQHACALRANGGIWCWGLGQLGQLGNGTAPQNSGNPVPVEVSTIDDAVQVSAGWNHTCALRSGGTIWCWGGNGDGATGFGQLGDGTLENRPSPVQVVGIDDAVRVAAGGWSTCALRSDGGAWCWGHGERGTLGDGNSTNSPVPVQVQGIAGAERLAVGFWHGCAALVDRSVWCWGDVGWGGSNPNATPVQGAGTLDTRVMSTDNDLLIVDGDGVLWQWGFGNGDAPGAVPVGP